MNITHSTSVQDTFLNKMKEQQAPLVIYIKNGFQVRGRIIDLDDVAILVQGEGKEQLIYKHAISTVCEADVSNNSMPGSYRTHW